MLLQQVAAVSQATAAEPARNAKVRLLAELLRGLGPDDRHAAVVLLSGESRRMRVGVGPAALRELPPPGEQPQLGIAETERALHAIAEVQGPGSQAERHRLLTALFSRATAEEQAFLRAVLGGELRQGALDAVMGDAVAKAAGVPVAEVRRALMFRGSAAAVADAAMDGGSAALRAFGLQLGRPIRPMLAASAPDVASALERIRPAALEWKLDGIRVQVHRDGDRVNVYTRSLDDITARVPEVVEAVRALPVRSVVLDGEALALTPEGRPRPFQVTAARTASRKDTEALRAETPLSVFFFDLLHLDGADLLDTPGERRFAELAAVVPPELRVPRLVTADGDGDGEGDPAAAEAFFRDALARGHEGVVVKDLQARYEAGRRGAGWIKVKPRHTLDLVVLAAEWGSGRRRGWLSNLHLGARADGAPDLPEGTGEWVMLGKTFKGLTDELLDFQTRELLQREVRRDDWTVHVRPELVVEIAFDGLQRSPRYPSGLTLRFARVLRYRADKRPEDADTIAAVRRLAAEGL
ncbi:ATP-dependent DNA ligase [Streptacidiphilus sp. PB12-B1b]|uniref:ATP-dependent DNA ligase n=1 Tax=Streptacidiphilus sp. PB12-B1b TaxID=2705012 RepID=UPI0015F8EDEC|nr:ATP-dependent DNA ligase [Streptacidiphilus sp. PB12-B1b]QMU77146.1 ATP-dependent DNA ligase [Streptacidiphilus sp. PB12-B1b]